MPLGWAGADAASRPQRQLGTDFPIGRGLHRCCQHLGLGHHEPLLRVQVRAVPLAPSQRGPGGTARGAPLPVQHPRVLGCPASGSLSSLLPREAVESPSLEIFKPRLDAVLCSLLWVTLLGQVVGLGDPQRALPTLNTLIL